jgi:uncharacterized protein (TIGR02145 family)
MKKLAAASIFIVILIAGCGVSSNDGQKSVSITATQPTAWEGSDDYLEFVFDLGSPNKTPENIVVYFEASGTGLGRDDIQGKQKLQQGYIEIPPGSQTATIRLDGFTSDGRITETQPIKINLKGCSSADYPIGPSSEATAIIMDGDGETVTDIDGNVYHTVLIGTQTWLVENLKTTRFRNGDDTQFPVASPGCYNKDPDNCNIYGRLYNWWAVNDPRGLAPSGWHVPDQSELWALMNAVNNDGNALKAIGQGSGRGAGTNTSGFSALLAGWFYSYPPQQGGRHGFIYLGEYTQFWSAKSDSGVNGWYLMLEYDGPGATLWYDKDYTGKSVRCIKD